MPRRLPQLRHAALCVLCCTKGRSLIVASPARRPHRSGAARLPGPPEPGRPPRRRAARPPPAARRGRGQWPAAEVQYVGSAVPSEVESGVPSGWATTCRGSDCQFGVGPARGPAHARPCQRPACACCPAPPRPAAPARRGQHTPRACAAAWAPPQASRCRRRTAAAPAGEAAAGEQQP